MIDLVFKNYTSQNAPGTSFFQNILETAVRELKLKDKVEASINLVGEAKIKELNKKYRRKDKPTDVLSFPMKSEGLHRPEGAKRLEEPFGYAQGRSNAIAFDLGDIFICLSIAKNEAKRENITIKDKLAQLVVHGFLHLSGYNHEKSKKDANKMLSLENKILSKL